MPVTSINKESLEMKRAVSAIFNVCQRVYNFKVMANKKRNQFYEESKEHAIPRLRAATSAISTHCLLNIVKG